MAAGAAVVVAGGADEPAATRDEGPTTFGAGVRRTTVRGGMTGIAVDGARPGRLAAAAYQRPIPPAPDIEPASDQLIGPVAIPVAVALFRAATPATPVTPVVLALCRAAVAAAIRPGWRAVLATAGRGGVAPAAANLAAVTWPRAGIVIPGLVTAASRRGRTARWLRCAVDVRVGIGRAGRTPLSGVDRGWDRVSCPVWVPAAAWAAGD